ncbi:MAG: methyltransferase domain-containing protein [Rhodospirillaceae bacterium]|jgi:NADH dehydrogenase [ubiquinone] 1 alpha subcomplex assembly factor 5|nr:methyltransferase domain-containing protein [Rhodospirillaceae bacterium]
MNDTETDDIRIFDRRAVRARRERAARALPEHDFLMREVADRLADRLDDIRRRFPRALDLGSRGPALSRAVAGRAGIEDWICAAPTPAAARDTAPLAAIAEEEAMPFAEGVFDLVLSSFALHWVNDLPGALLQVRRCLKPDGLFLAALPGGDSLVELRAALLEAEAAITGGASPRVSPFVDLRDAAGLLQRAGFALPVADIDTITVSYADPLALMRDLRGMGETGAMAARPRGFLRRDVLLEAARIYQTHHGGPDGRVPATFQIAFLTGWAPHADQPNALRPGSAQARLAEALGGEEVASGVKAGPGRPGEA